MGDLKIWAEWQIFTPLAVQVPRRAVIRDSCSVLNRKKKISNAIFRKKNPVFGILKAYCLEVRAR